MKNVMVLLIVFLGSLSINAQFDVPGECGMPTPTTVPPPLAGRNHCFDVDLVQQTCTKVWVRVNLHFFLDDNCEGTLDPLGQEHIPIEDAYELAENIINDANHQLGDGMYKQWIQIPLWGINEEKPVQCVPIRYALSGVYIHCDSNAKNTSGSNVDWFRNHYGVNPNTEFNAFFVEWQGNSTGQADGWGGKAFTAEVFSKSTFNHEFGHVFNLYHTFDPEPYEQCDDTPRVVYKIDYNCDGDTDDDWSSNGGLNERSTHRGIWCHPSDCGAISGVGPIDYDGDGVVDYPDPCDPALIATGCLPEPGCSWDYFTNNIMHYVGYRECCGAFTEDQITRMLDYLSTPQGCAFKEVITDDICLPPMANIHILPTENESVENDCNFCFQTQSSVHDSYFQIDFYDHSGSLHYSTNWKTGPTSEFCISRSVKNSDEYNYGFVPNVEYTAVLTVENVCGEEATESISFTLPNLPTSGCEEIPEDIKIESLYPNPFVQTINYEYKTESGGNLSAWLVPYTTGGSDVLIGTEYVPGAGYYTKSVSINNIQPGLYYLVLELEGKVISKTIIKI